MLTVVDQLPRLGKRELICLLLFTCNYVISVWRGFLFLWVLGMGYVILSWHSLSLPYNYFVQIGENDVKTAKDDPLGLNNLDLMHALINIVEEFHRQGVRREVFVPLFPRHHNGYNKRCNRLNKLLKNMPDANIMSHSDHMTRTLFEIDKIVHAYGE